MERGVTESGVIEGGVIEGGVIQVSAAESGIPRIAAVVDGPIGGVSVEQETVSRVPSTSSRGKSAVEAGGMDERGLGVDVVAQDAVSVRASGLKLAFCLFKYFPYGGLGRDFIRIARACHARGHEVHVYTMDWLGDVPDDIRITVVPVSGVTNRARCASFVKTVSRHLANAEYDRVVGFNRMPGLDIYYAADVCHEADVRQQRFSWLRFTPRHRLYSAYERAVFSRQSKTEILVISDRERRVYQQYFHTPQERFHLLPPGVSRDRLRPQNALEIRAEVRAEAHLAPDDILLLLVGSNFRKKGLDRALLGVASLPPEVRRRAQLFVLGKDRPNRWIRRARRLGLERQVRFLYLRSDIPRMLLGADLLLHPAHRENTGTIILEGLVAGLPVLATDVCGYAHYIADADAGRLVRSPFRQAEFDRQLHEMLTSGQLGHWSRQAVDYAKRSDLFSLTDRAAEAIEAIHASLLRAETLTT